MNRLAIETSTDACSVALCIGDDIVDEHLVEPRAHTQVLLPMINRLLSVADANPEDLDAIVLGSGPGSFIGIRIGASVAQGLAFGLGIDVIPVSSLAAVALEAIVGHDAERIAVAQDARMSEVYLGLFEKDEAGMVAAISPERIVAHCELTLPGRGFVAAGDAWRRFPALAERKGSVERILPIPHPKARYLLALSADANNRPVEPWCLEPTYLRSKVAEVPPVRR